MAFAGIAAAISLQAALIEVSPQMFEPGGWKCDVQFMDVMGSPYLLAHGAGQPVADAKARVEVPEAGRWRVKVRARNWWDGAPGAFRVLVNGRPLEKTFGVSQREWAWEDGGEIELGKGAAELRLRDETGFDGRCAGIRLEKGEVSEGERPIAARPVDDIVEAEFCIVGAGLPGCAAALAAARSGVKTVIVQDRPFLGGNASEEVRVWSAGEGKVQPIIEEIRGHYHNMEGGTVKDDARRRSLLEREANLTILTCTRVFAAEKAGDEIAAVTALDWRRDRIVKVRAKLFLDATGDGWLGYYAGADYRMGREAKAEFGENRYAPDKADDDTLGSSLMWTSSLANTDVAFSAPWAEASANGGAALHGDWYWEYGIHRDMISEAEHIRDRLLVAIYGSFSLAKKNPDNSRYALDFVPFILGKRESRRLMGDYVFNENDSADCTPHEDAIAKTSWSVDLHYDDAKPGVDYMTTCRQPHFGRAYVPFRSIYSRNVPNLMMAGRCFSCTHVGLGSPRVMNTLAQMGVAAGYAAKLWKRDGQLPRELCKAGKVREIQRLMGGDWPGNPDPAHEGWLFLDDEDEGMVFGKGWRKFMCPNGEQFGNLCRLAADDRTQVEPAVYPLKVPAAGRYELYQRCCYWPWPREKCAGEIAYDITCRGEKRRVMFNQFLRMGEWRRVGEFDFAPGDTLTIVPAESTSWGLLVADGFALRPVKAK